MTPQLILNIQRSLFLAESTALDEGIDFYDIDTRESVLAAYLEFTQE